MYSTVNTQSKQKYIRWKTNAKQHFTTIVNCNSFPVLGFIQLGFSNPKTKVPRSQTENSNLPILGIRIPYQETTF